MLDITIDHNGKIKKISTVEEKAHNLIYLGKGSVWYDTSAGFDLQQYIDSSSTINFSNIQSEINRYLLNNGVRIASITEQKKTLEAFIEMQVTSNNITEVYNAI